MKTRLRVSLPAALLAVALPSVALAQSHDLSSYVFLALHELRTKGITVTGAGDIGVNEPGGLLSASSHGEIDAPASRVVADVVRASAESRCATNGLFSNHVIRPMAACGPGAAVTLPVVADPNAACGFPASFPACDSANRVTVVGTTQTLAAHTYGDVQVMSGGRLVLTGGNYVFCSLRAGRNAEIVVRAPSTVSISGNVNLSNGVFLGSDSNAAVTARDLKLFVAGSSVHFSGSADVHATLCAPDAWLRITHGANVEGSFVARVVRTERITAGSGNPTTTSTTIAGTTTTTRAPGSTTTTTTTHAGSTTTTLASECAPGSRHCGNGHIDCGEQCDGTDFGNATCPGGTVPGQSLVCRSDCTIDDSHCGPVEICGNCIDDDGNGLTDFEDPACCPQGQTFAMSVTRGRLRPHGATSKLVLRSLLASRGLETVNPLKEDVFLQIRQPGGAEILCAQAPATHFMRMHKAFKFWDRKHQVASARGVQDIKVKVRRKKGGVRFRAFGRKVQMQTPAHGALQVTVGFHDLAGGPNMCSSQLQEFRTGRKGALRAP